MFPFQKNVSSQFGAPMGRHSDEIPEGSQVHIRKVPFVDGDYDPGGAYWGSGDTIWCIWNDEYTAYVRSRSKEEAQANFPKAVFLP
jgi:hypothetical protein